MPCFSNTTYFKTIAMDTPNGNLSLLKNIKAQTTALNRAITKLNRTNFRKILNEANVLLLYLQHL